MITLAQSRNILRGVEHCHTVDDQAIAITSLVCCGNVLWCGLTAGRNALVPFDTVARQFGNPIDVFPWVDERPQVVLSKIHNSLGLLNDGRLVIGEGVLFGWDGIPFEWARRGRDLQLQNRRRAGVGMRPLDFRRIGLDHLPEFDLRCMTGGRVLIFDPHTEKSTLVGTLPPYNYCQSMVVDPVRRRAYGHTLGDCHFFSADLDKKVIEDHGKISAFAFHELVVMCDGSVYGAWIDFDAAEALRIMRFDPAKGYVERLWSEYLDDAGPRVQGNRGIDAWLVHSTGAVFFGAAGDGGLYRFDVEQLRTTYIGRAGTGGRLTTLVEDESGRVMFTSGMPVMHVGRYDPENGQVEDLGPVTQRYEQNYFHGSCWHDGTLWLAETDSGVACLWEVALPE